MVYRTNPSAGLSVVTHFCKGFWGKPNGKVHISGFINTASGGCSKESANVHLVELQVVENCP